LYGICSWQYPSLNLAVALVDSAATRLQRLFTLSSSVILSDIQVNWLNSVELLEVRLLESIFLYIKFLSTNLSPLPSITKRKEKKKETEKKNLWRW